MGEEANVDQGVVSGFGHEWRHFDQSALGEEESLLLFNQYFAIFPWEELRQGAEGIDIGCGSGRWAKHVAPRVGKLHCLDPSRVALDVAQRNLASVSNCEFHHADTSSIPLSDNSLDFAYSLGVLHHVPDTARALQDCVRKLKTGAPMLIYLYYALENRPWWFRVLWKITDWGRILVARLPFPMKVAVTTLIAGIVYWPLARLALLLERIGSSIDNFPLSMYRSKSFYTMRTDALDRFGTRLEQRFAASEIREMMKAAGLRDVRMGPDGPYWCAVGYRA